MLPSVADNGGEIVRLPKLWRSCRQLRSCRIESRGVAGIALLHRIYDRKNIICKGTSLAQLLSIQPNLHPVSQCQMRIVVDVESLQHPEDASSQPGGGQASLQPCRQGS